MASKLLLFHSIKNRFALVDIITAQGIERVFEQCFDISILDIFIHACNCRTNYNMKLNICGWKNGMYYTRWAINLNVLNSYDFSSRTRL